MPDAGELRAKFRVTQEGVREAIDSAKSLREQVNQLIREFKDFQSTTKEPVNFEGFAKARGYDPSVIASAQREFNASVYELGKVGKFVFGTVLGITAVSVLRNLIGYFTGAVASAKEFVQALFQLEIGVRALQRSGVDVTIRDFTQEIAKLQQQFPIFSTAELAAGAANLANLTRDFGFTKEQIFSLMEASTTLAVVNGRDMEQVQRTLALAISSGYTEGLQRLGVSINRVTIAEKANEMGFKGGYTALTEHQRALATYQLILERVSKYAEDASKYQDTWTGKIDKATASFTNMRNTLGASILPLWASLVDFVGKAATSFTQLVVIIRYGLMEGLSNFLNLIIQFVTGIKALGDAVSKLDMSPLKAWFDVIKSGDIAKQAREEAMKIHLSEYATQLGDTTKAVVPEVSAEQEEAESKMKDTLSRFSLDIIEIESDLAKERERIARDYADDIAQLERDAQQRRAELALNLSRKLADIDRDAERSRQRASRDYANDLINIDRDFAQRQERERQKYLDKEYEAELKHLEDLRRLREEMLFDIEEAARQGDARTARQVLRRYRLDKDQLNRQYEIDKEARDRAFAREIEDLRQQAEQRKQERWIEFQQKLQDIQIQWQQQRADAQSRYQQDLADLEDQLARERQARQEKYRDQLNDLERLKQERLRSLAEGYAKEFGYTMNAAQSVYKLLLAYYGPNGYIEAIYKYYVQMVQRYGSILPQFTLPKPSTSSNNFGGGYAEGGTAIITRPTSLVFGERGAELVQTTPLSYVGANINKVFGNIPAGMGSKLGTGNSKISLVIGLDRGLRAEIVEQAMGEMVDVLTSLERVRQ